MGKKKILIVDDEPEMVQMLRVRLEASGYDVITAADGKEGLAQVRNNRPDLIVLDILMPVMDGMSMAETIKQDPALRGVPVIFLTALVEKKETDAAEHMIGGNTFLSKPYDVNEMLELIARVLFRAKE